MTAIPVRRSTIDFGSTRVFTPTIAALLVAAPTTAAFVGYASDWPASTTALAALLPLNVLVVTQVVATQRACGLWLAFFAVVTLPQLGHFGEHLGQMTQIHMLDAAPPKAHGAVGALDVEWVHFIWNGWVLVGVAILTHRFRSNPWLWVGLVVAAWHMTEHVAIMVDFWRTGVAGDPGLLAKGGAIGGGVDLIRADLHFLYNLAETAPLVAAYAWQLRRNSRTPDRAALIPRLRKGAAAERA